MPRPLLDGFELQQVQRLVIDGDRVLVRHGVPALEGDFLQQLGRRATKIDIAGVLTGPEASESLRALREKFRKAEPIDFVTDITTATQVGRVLIERMDTRELAGRPERFEYAFRLREFIASAVAPSEEPPIEPPPVAPPIDEGTLIVEVEVEGRPAFDFSRASVSVAGEKEAGTPLSRQLSNRVDNVWTEEGFPAGSYTVQAQVPEPEALTGTADAEVRPGETTQVPITLRSGQIIANAFVIHFHFDNAFVEPCMRQVLRQVVQHARDNADEKLLTVGHTDKAGSDAYNQSLSERRARAAFSFLMFGRDPQAAIDEWDQIRRQRPTGQLPSLNDSWGAREYQYILQDLKLYNGDIDGDHGMLTDQAVTAFRCLAGLPPGSRVDDATWRALIEHYLRRDNFQVPDDRFLGNCPGTILEWLGCGEERPTLKWGCPPRGTAWRPYRRVEFLFVRTDRLPCQAPRPATLDLPVEDPPPPEPRWCLGPVQPPPTRGCLLRYPGPRECQPPRQAGDAPWLVQPIDSATVTVEGTIRFEGSTPNSPIRFEYVLITPEGEFADGENSRGAAIPLRVQGTTDANGVFEHQFSHPDKTVGVYTLEIRGGFVVRRQDDPATAATGTVVCKRLDGGDRFDVIVTSRPAVVVHPTITAGRDFVLVKKTHTNPARLRVLLRLDFPFCQGDGLFTRSSDAIRFFTAASGGAEITFDGIDNTFTGSQLSAGVELFAEGFRASGALNDVVLTLTVTPSPTSSGPAVGPPATLAMTSVELTLDISVSRTDPAIDPATLSEADKVNVGRFVQVADPLFTHERAMLTVRQTQPARFNRDLELSPLDNRVAIFADEVPTAGQAAVAAPVNVPAATIPPDGRRFFVEGRTLSGGARDTGVRLGVAGIERDGDRVNITVVQVEIVDEASNAAAHATFVRFGLWDRAYDEDGNVRNNETEANNFVGSDTRKFHFRVRDTSGPAGSVSINWRSLRRNRTDDDAPASQLLTLPETAAGSTTFISRGVLLVTDNTDRNQPTHSGLAAPLPDTGIRNRGNSNHRLRRAALDGFVRAEYTPQPQVILRLERPLFDRIVDERRRVNARVIRYTNAADPTYQSATAAYIAGQFQHANDRWNQVGLQVDSQATVSRQIPAAALNAGRFPLSHPNGVQEQAVLRDLIPITPDNTLTVVFAHMSGTNGYAAILRINPIPAVGPDLTIDDRFFLFVNTTLDLNDETLAHELHHVLFNRLDTATGAQFFSFNTNPPGNLALAAGIALPDPRIERRIQNRNSPNPNNDPNNDNIINWVRRTRTSRYDPAGGLGPATATTGNTLVTNF